MIIQMEVTKEERLIRAIKLLANMARPEYSEEVDDLQDLINEGVIGFDQLDQKVSEEMKGVMGIYSNHCDCSNCMDCLGMTARDFF